MFGRFQVPNLQSLYFKFMQCVSCDAKTLPDIPRVALALEGQKCKKRGQYHMAAILLCLNEGRETPGILPLLRGRLVKAAENIHK